MSSSESIGIIEGQTLTISAREVNKLTNQEGCYLQAVSDKVLKLEDDDNGFSDDDDLATYGNDEHSLFDNKDVNTDITRQAKEEQMKREYISVILNASNDPIKPGSKFRTRDFCQSSELCSSLEDNNFELGNLEDRYLGIHRMYENIGSFDAYMAKNTFEEISTNLVHKMKRVPGLGDHTKVTNDCLVIYNCALWVEGAKDPFDSSWLRRTSVITNMATDSLLPGIRELLLSTQQGEICEAIIRPEAAFGHLGAMPRIPANATIFCLLHVERVVTPDKIAKLMRNAPVSQDEGTEPHGPQDGSSISTQLASLSFEDFFEASDEARRRGNYFYEREQYRVALQRYKSAIRLLEGYSYQDDKQEARAKELLIKLYNNCARASNAMGNPRGALGACKQASLIDDNVPKTYWLRMSAWAKKGHLDRALGVARRAMQLFPDPKVSKPFAKAADEYKLRLQQERVEVDKLHRLMSRALISSA